MSKENVVLKSQISLRRNLKNYKFLNTIEIEMASNCKKEIIYALDEIGLLDDCLEYNYGDLPTSKQEMLKSSALVADYEYEDIKPYIIVDKDKSTSVTINSDSHIQLVKAQIGLSLKELYDQVMDLERKLDKRLQFAFSDKLGYLTEDIDISGSLMDFAVILNLKALKKANKLAEIENVLNLRGYILEAIYKKDPNNGLYLIRNAGDIYNPDYTIEDVTNIINKIVEKEEDERSKLIHSESTDLKDELLRSIGMLKYSRVIDEAEAMTALSNLLVATDLGIEDYKAQDIIDLMDKCRRINLMEYRDRKKLTQNLGVLRSELIREFLEG
ncbi:MAG: hypothetical protein SPI59_02475 [Finegoldia sp.]|nr:hypothetical protein [Finegoldia sp.]